MKKMRLVGWSDPYGSGATIVLEALAETLSKFFEVEIVTDEDMKNPMTYLKFDGDVIYTSDYFTLSKIPPNLLRKRKYKIVLEFRGYSVDKIKNPNWENITKNADIITAVDPTLAEWVRSNTGIKDIPILPPSYNKDLFRFKGFDRTPYKIALFGEKNETHLLYPYLYSPVKKPQNFVEICNKLGVKGIMFRYPLMLMSSPLNIYLVDFLPQYQMVNYYYACDIVCAYTEIEGMPKAPLEAMATGRPIIMHFVPGLLRDSPVIAVKDIEEACDKIKELLEDEDKYKSQVTKQLEFVSKWYSWEDKARQIYEIIERAQ